MTPTDPINPLRVQTTRIDRGDTLLDYCRRSSVIAPFSSTKVVVGQADTKDQRTAFSDLADMSTNFIGDCKTAYIVVMVWYRRSS